MKPQSVEERLTKKAFRQHLKDILEDDPPVPLDCALNAYTNNLWSEVVAYGKQIQEEERERIAALTYRLPNDSEEMYDLIFNSFE